MHPLIQLKKATSIFLVISMLASFGLSPTAQAQLPPPPPDGGYPNFNTAEGDSALFNLTTGVNNTAIGFSALFTNTTGSENTATGVSALASNTTGGSNTAIGFGALFDNTTGSDNTATGASALVENTTGVNNTANGFETLFRNTTGSLNTANGFEALEFNTTGGANTATGNQALLNNTIGNDNTANGVNALINNTTGSFNTATGLVALQGNTTGSNNTANGLGALVSNTTGSSNIGVGFSAGGNLTTGSNNIDIGNAGVAGESGTIRIGTQGTQTKAFIVGIHGVPVTGVAVKVTATGQLDVAPSSARFKDEIRPIDKASEAILALKPVAFRYKKDVDPDRTLQFGLVAEDVEKVNSDLVVRDADGKVYTVRYDAVNAMLLNEFLKEHCKVESLEKAMAEQQKENAAMRAMLKEQAAQIQKVSAQLEVTKPAPQAVLNNQ
jgi:hypothetical protein